MKTAEEWQKKMCHANTVRAEWIKKIQLEAYKAGMSEAIEICERFGSDCDCARRILKAHDTKTSYD